MRQAFPCYGRVNVPVDVVVVSFNSAGTLAGCIDPLCGFDEINVIVVDNASTDASVEVASSLPVTVLALEENRGFAHGCNRGWRAGSAEFALFLNPDARIDHAAIHRLEDVAQETTAGLVAPRISDADGALEFSIRRFPRLRSTYSRALFLHRVFPRATWSDEDVRDPAEYERPHVVDWVSGACLLVRRDALEQLNGWDETFFHYGEDIDLCRRLWSHGFEVRFEPTAQAVHIGGASAPRPRLRPLMVSNRVRYARKHRRRPTALLEQGGAALEELTRAALTRKGSAARAGHLGALRVALRRKPHADPSVRRWSDPSGVETRTRDD